MLRKRIAEHGPADMNEEWNQRRLVNVAPGEVVAAGDVVEFVAEVAVPVIEINVEQEIGAGNGPDEHHARREPGSFFVLKRMRSVSG